MGVIA